MTILESKNLRIGYVSGQHGRIVAEGLDFSLKKRTFTCLLGPNGVGKSTLVKTLLGQLPPLEGDVILEGRGIGNFSQKELAKKIAVVLTEKTRTGNLTVYQLVSLGRIPHTGWLGGLSPSDEDMVEEAIAATHIGYIRHFPLSELSDGQLQKAMIARALAQDADILILDEPTAHLDLVNRHEIMHLLRDIAHGQNKAVLVVTHDLDIAVQTADIFWLMGCGDPLSVGFPEDLILDNSISRLFPQDKFRFDLLFGKVVPKLNSVLPTILGPTELVKWVENAWRKNLGNLILPGAIIEINADPFGIQWKVGETVEKFSSVQSLVEFVEKHYRKDFQGF